MKRLIAALSLLLLAPACGDDVVLAVRSDLRVTASHFTADNSPLMDFGPVAVLDKRVLNVLVTNHGRASGRIESLEIEGPEGVFFVTGDFTLREIPGGEWVEIPITFQPGEQEPYHGTFTLHHDDEEKAPAVIALSGVGSTVGRLEFEPLAVDFGVVGEGTQEVRNLRLRSVGTGPLVVDSIELLDSPPEFAFLGSTRPARLPPPADGQPGGSVDLRIACAPTEATEDANLEGTIRLVTTDPDHREVLIPLSALVNRAPVAKVEVEGGVHVAGAPIALDGSESFDPDGDLPLSYEWRIFSQPFGANATLSDPRIAQPTLLVDTPGSYEIGLDVIDGRGLYCHAPGGDTRIPCDRKLVVVQSDVDILVELVWNHSVTDLDLHLRESGAPLYSDLDCYSENREPDFGAFGDPTDDPVMTHESLKGFGPERISFAKPGDGKFDVVVVFAKTNGAVEPASAATVRVYIHGSLQVQLTRTVEEADQVWEVISIDWPSAEITRIDSVAQAVTP